MVTQYHRLDDFEKERKAWVFLIPVLGRQREADIFVQIPGHPILQ